MGLGDEALKHAEEAVKLEPENDQAWSTLAWTLEFNPLGRRFGKGFDRTRSAEAFRKAIVLNPDAWNPRPQIDKAVGMLEELKATYGDFSDFWEDVDAVIKELKGE